MKELPEQFRRAQELINSRLAASIKRASETIDAAQQKQKQELAAITQATMIYLSTGIYDQSMSSGWIDIKMHGGGWGHSNFSWVQYFRRIAKELNRPFVYVQSGSYWSEVDRCYRYGVSVNVPKRAYCRPLIAGLLILPPEVTRPHHNTVEWSFHFASEHREIYQSWRDMCERDPQFRRALRLA